MRFVLSIVAWFVIWVGATHAQSRLQAMNSLDDSRAWAAVGRLNVMGGGFCTATLISDTQVLTAGHCLYDARTGLPVPVERMEFWAGWTHGRAEAYRRIKRAVPHPDYQFSGNAGVDRVARDVALLELDMPIRHPNIRPFEIAQLPRLGSEVGVVSYAHDRAEAPSLQEVCHLVAEENEVLVLNCNIDFGSSGAPIFRFDLGVPLIVSVVSAKAKMGTAPVALGAKARSHLWALQDVMSRGFAPSVPAPAPQVPDLGAKFLKP